MKNQENENNPVSVDETGTVAVSDELVLPLSGDRLKFKPKLDTATYIKMKRDMQKVTIVASRSKSNTDDTTLGAALPVETDYFVDLCTDIFDRNGARKAVNPEYLFKLELEDFYLVEAKMQDLTSKKV